VPPVNNLGGLIGSEHVPTIWDETATQLQSANIDHEPERTETEDSDGGRDRGDVTPVQEPKDGDFLRVVEATRLRSGFWDRLQVGLL
jgi:hypothetical protein